MATRAELEAVIELLEEGKTLTIYFNTEKDAESFKVMLYRIKRKQDTEMEAAGLQSADMRKQLRAVTSTDPAKVNTAWKVVLTYVEKAATTRTSAFLSAIKVEN